MRAEEDIGAVEVGAQEGEAVRLAIHVFGKVFVRSDDWREEFRLEARVEWDLLCAEAAAKTPHVGVDVNAAEAE